MCFLRQRLRSQAGVRRFMMRCFRHCFSRCFSALCARCAALIFCRDSRAATFSPARRLYATRAAAAALPSFSPSRRRFSRHSLSILIRQMIMIYFIASQYFTLPDNISIVLQSAD